MKMNYKSYCLVILISVFCLIAAGCNVPLKSDPVPTAAPAAAATEEAPMLIHNNSGGTGDEVPVTDPGEGTAPEENDEELPLITNPDRSTVSYPKTASLGFRSASSFSNINTQIVRPTEDLVIVNDNRVQYQENQSIIQKSTPAGQLQPLSYIPPTYLASGQSIQFAAGATSAVISGYVQAGGYVSYNFYAFANQNFLVLLSSDSGTSVLSVSDVYGNVFLDASQQQTSLNMYLPRTATYYVNIHSRGYTENFTLQIFIPARVTIPAGQTKAVMSGTVAPYSVVSYTAYMYAGQTARIDDYSGARPTSFLRISGLQTGQVYMDYTSYSPSWYSVVPATQDYLIELISMDQSSYYQLTVDVR